MVGGGSGTGSGTGTGAGTGSGTGTGSGSGRSWLRDEALAEIVREFRQRGAAPDMRISDAAKPLVRKLIEANVWCVLKRVKSGGSSSSKSKSKSNSNSGGDSKSKSGGGSKGGALTPSALKRALESHRLQLSFLH
jgi:hypothetical protein